MTAHSGCAIWMRVVSLIAIGFGLMTIWEGGAVLFVDGAARHAAIIPQARPSVFAAMSIGSPSRPAAIRYCAISIDAPRPSKASATAP